MMKYNITNLSSVLMRCLLISFLLLYAISCVCIPAFANGPEEDYVPDDTDGTEMQVMQPSRLEIQFGSDWAGAEFELETDVGEYPGTVPVSVEGTLSMELGGSETYVLRLVETPAAPVVEATPEPTAEPTPEPTPEPTEEPVIEEEPPEEEIPVEEPVPEESNGLPVFAIVLFGVGLVIAVGVLVAMRVITQRRGRDEDDDGENDG